MTFLRGLLSFAVFLNFVWLAKGQCSASDTGSDFNVLRVGSPAVTNEALQISWDVGQWQTQTGVSLASNAWVGLWTASNARASREEPVNDCCYVAYFYPGNTQTSGTRAWRSVSPGQYILKLMRSDSGGCQVGASVSFTVFTSRHPTTSPTPNPITTTPTQSPLRGISFPLSDASKLPLSSVNISIDTSTLTIYFKIQVEFVRSAITYVIDFAPFAGVIQNPSSCENRKAKDFKNVSWSSIWSPSQPSSVGTTHNLLFPPTLGTLWNVRRVAPNTVEYDGAFQWVDLLKCKDKQGAKSISINTTRDSVTQRGTIFVSAVAPFNPSASFGAATDYYVNKINHQQFAITTNSIAFVGDFTNTFFGTTLQAQINVSANAAEMILFTNAGKFMHLTAGTLLNGAGYVRHSVTRFLATSTSCLVENASQSSCMQAWKLSIHRAPCPHDYTKSFRVEFGVMCRGGVTSAALTQCQEFKTTLGPSASIEIDFKPVLKDLACNSTTNEALQVPFQLSLGNQSTNKSTLFTYTAGQSIVMKLSADTSASGVNVTHLIASGALVGFEVSKIFACTAADGSSIAAPNQLGQGGCLPPSLVDGMAIVWDGSEAASGWNIGIQNNFPHVDLTIVAPALPPNRFFYFVQIQVVVKFASARRRLQGGSSLSTGQPISSYSFLGITIQSESPTQVKPKNTLKPVEVRRARGSGSILKLEVIIGLALGSCLIVQCLGCVCLFGTKRGWFTECCDSSEKEMNDGLQLESQNV